MKITEIVKDWLRSKCGGNYHQVLGHLRAMPKGYGGPKEEVMLKVPIVVAGRRIKLQGTWDQFRALAQPATDDLFLSTFEKCLWPCLPLRGFGNLFHGDQSPTTIRSELRRHYGEFDAWFTHQIIKFRAACRRVKAWLLASDQSFECPYVYDTPWYRFLPGGPFPQRLGETKRIVSIEHALPETEGTFTRTWVRNPEWKNAEFDIMVWDFERMDTPQRMDATEFREWTDKVKAECAAKSRGKSLAELMEIISAPAVVNTKKSVKRKKSTPRNQTSGRGAGKRKAAK